MLVAEGAAEIALDPAAALWDLAAPMVIVAGGRRPLHRPRRQRHRRPAATGSRSNGLVHEAARRILAAERRLQRCPVILRPWSDCSARTWRRTRRSPRRRPRWSAPGAEVPLATRMRPTTLDELVGPGAAAGAGLGAAARDRGGPPALDDPARAAGVGQDDAGAPGRPRLGCGARGGERGGGGPRRGARGDRARPRAAAQPAAGRCSSSTRSTASTRPSRTRCCRRSRTG